MSLSDYYHGLNTLWKQYDAMVKLPSCTCAAAPEFQNHNKILKLNRFLMGLDDGFMHIRSNLLLRDPIPDVKTAFAVISREESHRSITSNQSSSKGQNTAFLSQVRNIGSNQSNNNNNNINEYNRGPNSNLKYFNLKISHSNGTVAKIRKIENLKLSNDITLYDVLVVPGNCVSLLSVSKMTTDSNLFVGFDNQKCYIQDLKSRNILGTCSIHKGLYVFDNKEGEFLSYLVIPQVLFYTFCQNKLNIDKKDIEISCEICLKAKQTRDPFPLSEHKTTELGDLLHMDLWGPYRVVSKEGYSTQFNKKVKIIRTDNGTEFVNFQMSNLINSLGIIHQTTIPYTPQQNEVAERKHRHLLNIPRLMKVPMMKGEDYQMKIARCQPLLLPAGPEPRRSDRQSTFPRKDDDYIIEGKVKYGIEKVVNYSNLSHNNYCFISSLNKSTELKTYSQAVTDPNWQAAMNDEMEALYRNNTWVLTELPSGRKPIGCRWIYKIKYRSTGEIERYKARLVAKGYSQKEGIDYDETFSPVVKMVNVRYINNAFLYGDLTEDVYMELPQGYFPENETNSSGSLFMALLVYVDDIVITDEFGLVGCKPVGAPLEANLTISSEPTKSDPLLDNVTEFQKLIGKLIYLTMTRPDISFSVQCLSQFMHSPLQSHLKIALRLLRYLKASLGKGVLITKSDSNSLVAYLEADWGKCTSTRKSVTGYAVFFCNSLVSWKSKKQATVSRSSTESEYRAMASVTCEILWIIKILTDLHCNNLLPVRLFYDNRSAIQLAANPVFHERSKHFEIDLHVVRQKSVSGVIEIVNIDSEKQIADIFIKGLGINQHNFFCDHLNLVDMFHA
ncbi:uncharacterized protein [Rutidosis leptorrhynchoides]|uniref:uncharacterized protein n=1 Tax=Rutidosis leptorrhynchoides TaxID=125765 RepID=UPI003A98E4B1